MLMKLFFSFKHFLKLNFTMNLSIIKILIVLLCITYCWSVKVDHDHTDRPSTNPVCNNDTQNDQCETVAVNSSENSTDFFNSTTINGEEANSTVSSEIDDGRNDTTELTETTTPLPSPTMSTTMTTTTSIKSTTEPSYDMHFIPEDVCSCDMTIEYCDINCCCDEDCTGSDRQAFSHCFKRTPLAPDPRYCYQTDFVYRNNTEYKMVQNKEGLFCILWDNLPSETRFIKRKVVTKLEDFKKLYRRRKIYQWPTDTLGKEIFQPVSYRAGSVVWSISNITISPLAFPNKLVSAFCETLSSIQYLSDWSGSCSVTKMDCAVNSGLSATSFYGPFFIIAAPQYMNQSQITYFMEQQECWYNTCLQFDLFLCSSMNNFEDCLPVDEIENPIYDNETAVCLNVVKWVKYRIYHNGTFGITKAEAYFWTINLKNTQTDLRQTFSVEFVWADSPRKPFQRSGNPGYIIGKPVIAGKKVLRVSVSDDEPDKEAILLSEEQSKWLTFPRPGFDSLCIDSMAEGNRISVTFGENLLSSCFIELSVRNFSSRDDCSLLQRKILVVLLGDVMINVTDSKEFNMYVATFGNANVEETGDWVPVLLENMPILSIDWKQDALSLICGGVATSMHINIVTSKVGLSTNPQSKILGVVIAFGAGQDLVFDCSPRFCSNDVSKKQMFEIRSSVSFVDVSKPPVIYFAEPPVYEVKLPYDFFYPFLSSYNPRLKSCWLTYLLIHVPFLFYIIWFL